MRVENLFCEECGVVHFVEVVQRDHSGLVIKTKCMGKDFFPIQSNPALNAEAHIIKHKLRGYDIIKKSKPTPKSKLVTTFKRQPVATQPIPVLNRVCLVEVSFSLRGQIQTIKVFEDATPDKFYEVFYEVSPTPKMIKPRTLGMGKPVHVSEIQRLFKIEGKVKIVFYNRPKYEKLLTMDPGSVENILEKNIMVASKA